MSNDTVCIYDLQLYVTSTSSLLSTQIMYLFIINVNSHSASAYALVYGIQLNACVVTMLLNATTSKERVKIKMTSQCFRKMQILSAF